MLSGEADQLRIARKMKSILDNSYVEYYDNQYAGEEVWRWVSLQKLNLESLHATLYKHP